MKAKLLGLLAAGLMVAPVAPAGITVALDSVTPGAGMFNGYYIWSYSAVAPPTDSLFGAYFTIYDWNADIYTVEAAADWHAGTSLLGDTPSGLSPTDDATIRNITFSFTKNQPGDIYAGFRIISTVGTSGAGGYSWYDFDVYPTQQGHARSGLGSVQVAERVAAVPEPGSLALLALGLAGLGLTRRRET